MVDKQKYVVITGGLGYIGSHTDIELLENNYNKIIIIDNLSNSSKKILKRIKEISKKEILFFKKDLRDKSIFNIFKKYKIDCVIHFAGLKSINESEKKFKLYFNNNVMGSLNLFQAMDKYDCRKIIFSSSANVYNQYTKAPFKESNPIRPSSKYGLTKVMIEKFLRMYSERYNKKWSVVILRYFNPIGAHCSGLLKENINKAENIIPKITKVLINKNKKFFIWGNNYETKDGTCLRDYIHVSDVAKFHLKSLKILKRKNLEILNIGTGKPHSVIDILKTFKKITKKNIPIKIGKKRPGDVAINYADINKSKKIFKNIKYRSLTTMIKDVTNAINI